MHIIGIDGLRLVASLCVVFHHLGSLSQTSAHWTIRPVDPLFQFIGSWTEYGWVGVPFFFVLSGFVIANSASRATATQFVLNRIVRLMPALWICSTVTLLVVVATTGLGDHYFWLWLRNIVLWPKGPHLDGVIWTLIVEAVFYAITAIVVRFSASRGSYKKIRDQFAIALILWCGLFAVWQIGQRFWEPDQIAATYGFVFTFLLLRHGAFFGLGMLMWSILETGWTGQRIIFVLIATLVSIAQIVLWTEDLHAGAITSGLWLISVVLLVCAIRVRNVRLPVSITAALRISGRVSYPLYLGHFTISVYLGVYLHAAGLSSGVIFAFLLLGVLILALAIAQGPELWLQRKLKRSRPMQIMYQSTRKVRYARGDPQEY